MSDKSVLVINGDAAAHEVIVDRLERDYAILIARTSEDGINIFISERPAVVIINLKTPFLSSVELLKKIRSESREASLVLLTDYDELCAAEDALRCADADFLMKPFDAQQIYLKVEHAYRRYQITRAKREIEDIFDTISDAITIHDGNYTIVRANKSAEGLLGCGIPELLGKKCFASYHGESTPPHGCPSCRVLKTSEPATAEFYEPHLKKFVEIKALPRLNHLNEIAGVVHVVRDITERKKAEEEIIEQRTQAQQYLNIAQVMIVALNTKGEITLINEKGCGILGYQSESELISRNWFELFVPAERRLEIHKLFNHFIDGAPEFFEYCEHPVVTSRGERRIVAFHNILIRDKQKGVTGILFSGIDITNQQEAERLKSEFLSNVSHELRTPLNGILCACELLSDSGALTEEQTEYITTISSSGSHLSDLISRLLHFSILELGNPKKIKLSFAVERLFGAVVGDFRGRAEARGVALRYVVENGVPERIKSDPIVIYQILKSLIDNAVKFTEQGSIMVRVQPGAEGMLLISVQDTGIGVPSNMKGPIFDNFVQADGSLSRRYEGMGIGLPMAKKLIHLIGGELRCESMEGKGSVFSFTLPFEAASVSETEQNLNAHT